MRFWPFGSVEKRSGSYTEAAIAHIESAAGGASVLVEELAAVEAAAGLWERCIASARVDGPGNRLAGVDGPFLALVGRSLALRGNFVAAISVEAGTIALRPAASWDIRGAGADARFWRYRLDMAGPSGAVSLDLPSASVLHVRIGADARTPWRGRAPLERARATAGLAGKIEKALDAEAGLAVGRIATFAGATPEQIEQIQAALNAGGWFVTMAGQPGGAGPQEPNRRYEPVRIGPDPPAILDTLRGRLGPEIAAAFGIPPPLFALTGDGAGQREAWRRFWLGTIAPVARILEGELRFKTDPGATVTLDALAAADEDGRSRAISRRAAAFKTFLDAGLEREQALSLAGLG